jgi:transcriptional regulator with XRE-family HTH domain
MEFKDRLIYAMEQKKVKQIELSNRTGLAPGTISNYMQGKYKAKGENLRKLAYALNVDPGWLDGVPEASIEPTNDLIDSQPWEEKYYQDLKEKYSFTDLEYMLIEKFREADNKTRNIIISLLDLEEFSS